MRIKNKVNKQKEIEEVISLQIPLSKPIINFFNEFKVNF